MKNKKCHICSHVNPDLEGQVSFCQFCGTDLADQTAETLVRAVDGSFATADSLTVTRAEADILLTDKRLIVIPMKLEGFGLTGMLTAAVYNKMMNPSGMISIPFTAMKTVRDGKFGLLVKAIMIDTTSGELLKITMSKMNEWKDLLKQKVTVS